MELTKAVMRVDKTVVLKGQQTAAMKDLWTVEPLVAAMAVKKESSTVETSGSLRAVKKVAQKADSKDKPTVEWKVPIGAVLTVVKKVVQKELMKVVNLAH